MYVSVVSVFRVHVDSAGAVSGGLVPAVEMTYLLQIPLATQIALNALRSVRDALATQAQLKQRHILQYSRTSNFSLTSHFHGLKCCSTPPDVSTSRIGAVNLRLAFGSTTEAFQWCRGSPWFRCCWYNAERLRVTLSWKWMAGQGWVGGGKGVVKVVIGILSRGE